MISNTWCLLPANEIYDDEIEESRTADDIYELEPEEESSKDCSLPRDIVKDGYATLGPPIERCSKCHAIMWKEERVNKNVKHERHEGCYLRKIMLDGWTFDNYRTSVLSFSVNIASDEGFLKDGHGHVPNS